VLIKINTLLSRQSGATPLLEGNKTAGTGGTRPTEEKNEETRNALSLLAIAKEMRQHAVFYRQKPVEKGGGKFFVKK